MQFTQNNGGFSTLQPTVADQLSNDGSVLLLDPRLIVLL